MTTKLQLVDAAAEILKRLDPQITAPRVRAERLIDELVDQDLITVDAVRDPQGAPRYPRMIGQS